MQHLKILPLDEETEEIQVWEDNVMIGAGAYKKGYSRKIATHNIIEAWLLQGVHDTVKVKEEENGTTVRQG